MVTLQFVPYREIQDLSSLGRIRKLLNIAKQNKIVLLQGRLKKAEEAELIKVTMEEINKEFKGIELAVIQPNKNNSSFMGSLRSMILGDSDGLTIIGPATVVKSIKKNPKKIELLTQEKRRRKK